MFCLQVNKTTSQFSFITNLADVCRILDLPREYVLKVRARVFENEMVDACLKSIGKTDSFTVAFRITYVEVSFILHIFFYFPAPRISETVCMPILFKIK